MIGKRLRSEIDVERRLLSIYLNDHLAGATGAIALVRRSLSRNADHPVGVFLTGLLPELESDRASLVGVMRRLEVAASPVKQAAGWTLEKVGRLKLNGSLTGYTPLARLEELEALRMGIDGKLALWEALAETSTVDHRLQRSEFEALADRARAQRDELEKFRVEAAKEAFQTSVAPD